MKFKKIFWITVILLLLPFSMKVWSGDFGQSSSLFTDIKAAKVGDILTVLIYESANATNEIETKTKKDGKVEVDGGPGLGPLDFIPLFGVNGEYKNNYNGKGENSRTQSLRAKMTVTVIGVRDNGDLIISGSRTIAISKDKETMTLTGVVRQKDVTAHNTVDSYLIADAEITYTGRGAASNGSRPGPIMRFLNWLF
ncbi:MAG: flagellar basal body L-ring protein FlgH [Candidatus Zixiibacteriota bacterium]|nr:MAG: flagellar basal body L-ring protein FlgH [candidate division Zixibacteria bacterium]